jgi:hypothetical protein
MDALDVVHAWVSVAIGAVFTLIFIELDIDILTKPIFGMLFASAHLSASRTNPVQVLCNCFDEFPVVPLHASLTEAI